MIDEEILSLSEAAKYMKVTRQAVYVAIRKKSLKGFKKNDRWYVLKSDIEGYRVNKYNPKFKKVEGEYIYSLEEGLLTVEQASKAIGKMLGCPYNSQHLYYLIRKGILRAYKRSYSWVIKHEDLAKIYEMEKAKVVDRKERFG